MTETVFRIDVNSKFVTLFCSEMIGNENTDYLNELPESEECHSHRESFK